MTGIRRSFQKLDGDTFVPLYKALVRTHLDYACCIWSPYKQTYKDALENVQRRATKQINGMSDNVLSKQTQYWSSYDTVWHRGLKLKLNNVIPDKSLVNFIMTLIASRSFIMHVGADRSKQRFLKNGVPQGSVLAPLLFNLYTSDLPKTQSKKYIYADDIALMISGKTFGPIEQSVSEDLDTMSRYFNNWRLKINTGKTVCTSFHLAHRLAKYQLQVTCEGQNIPHEDNRLPKLLGSNPRQNSNIQGAHK